MNWAIFILIEFSCAYRVISCAYRVISKHSNILFGIFSSYKFQQIHGIEMLQILWIEHPDSFVNTGAYFSETVANKMSASALLLREVLCLDLTCTASNKFVLI
jgi:hypothetical protein